MSKKIKLEESLSELENIVKHLEDGNCSLDESIELFKKGIEISGECKKTLDNARQTVISLTEAEAEENDD